jgi:hypothetical protein
MLTSDSEKPGKLARNSSSGMQGSPTPPSSQAPAKPALAATSPNIAALLNIAVVMPRRELTLIAMFASSVLDWLFK